MDYHQVIGQEALQRRLTELVQQNRLSHALLFLSKEGTGALPLAMSFAQYLVCETVAQQGGTAPCGTCPACHKATLPILSRNGALLLSYTPMVIYLIGSK